MTSNLVKATSCKHSYGIKVAEPFSEANAHDPRDGNINDISGVRMAEGQLLWMLNIGDVVLSSRPYKKEQDITVPFNKEEEKRGQITVYRSSEPLPERPTQFRNCWAGKLLHRLLVSLFMAITMYTWLTDICQTWTLPAYSIMISVITAGMTSSRHGKRTTTELQY